MTMTPDKALSSEEELVEKIATILETRLGTVRGHGKDAADGILAAIRPTIERDTLQKMLTEATTGNGRDFMPHNAERVILYFARMWDIDLTTSQEKG